MKGPVSYSIRILKTLVIAGCWLVAAGCADPPDDRYEDALEAAEKAEDLEDYLLYFTSASAEMLRGTNKVATSKSKDLAYLEDIRTILPGKEVEEVEERGSLALLTVSGNEGKPIRMLREKGEWVIDAYSLSAFWKPLRAEAEE